MGDQQEGQKRVYPHLHLGHTGVGGILNHTGGFCACGVLPAWFRSGFVNKQPLDTDGECRFWTGLSSLWGGVVLKTGLWDDWNEPGVWTPWLSGPEASGLPESLGLGASGLQLPGLRRRGLWHGAAAGEEGGGAAPAAVAAVAGSAAAATGAKARAAGAAVFGGAGAGAGAAGFAGAGTGSFGRAGAVAGAAVSSSCSGRNSNGSSRSSSSSRSSRSSSSSCKSSYGGRSSGICSRSRRSSSSCGSSIMSLQC